MRFSVIVGAIGGVVDEAAGLVLLMRSMGPDAMSATWMGLGLMGLGAIVLVTTGFLIATPMDRSRIAFGGLMLAYGIAMLALGVVMLTGTVPMMSGSLLSGLAMILVGIGMLYSGVSMTRM